MQNLPYGADVANGVEPNQEERSRGIAALRAALDVPIARVTKSAPVGGTYRLILDDGSAVVIGRVKAVFRHRAWRLALLDQAGIFLRSLQRREWQRVLENVLLAIETVGDRSDNGGAS